MHVLDGTSPLRSVKLTQFGCASSGATTTATLRRSATAHGGPVTSIATTTTHPHLFLTSSADTTIKLWSLTTPATPRIHWTPFTHLSDHVQSVMWCTPTSTCFVACSASGEVVVFDVTRFGRAVLVPVASYRVEGGAGAATSAFGTVLNRMLAVARGDNGGVSLLRLPACIRGMGDATGAAAVVQRFRTESL